MYGTILCIFTLREVSDKNAWIRCVVLFSSGKSQSHFTYGVRVCALVRHTHTQRERHMCVGAWWYVCAESWVCESRKKTLCISNEIEEEKKPKSLSCQRMWLLKNIGKKAILQTSLFLATSRPNDNEFRMKNEIPHSLYVSTMEKALSRDPYYTQHPRLDSPSIFLMNLVSVFFSKMKKKEDRPSLKIENLNCSNMHMDEIFYPLPIHTPIYTRYIDILYLLFFISLFFISLFSCCFFFRGPFSYGKTWIDIG